jgi:hypothetical protein
VDGLVTFTMDTNPEITVAQAADTGELGFFSRIHYGGGTACATVQQAAIAVATRIAEVVVCYRAFNERSSHRFGSGLADRRPSAEGVAMGWTMPYGLLTPASWVALAAQRYLHSYRFTNGRGRRPRTGCRGGSGFRRLGRYVRIRKRWVATGVASSGFSLPTSPYARRSIRVVTKWPTAESSALLCGH